MACSICNRELSEFNEVIIGNHIIENGDILRTLFCTNKCANLSREKIKKMTEEYSGCRYEKNENGFYWWEL